MTVSYNSLWHRDGRICHILRREYVQTEEDMNEKCIMQGEAWYLKWKRVEKWSWFVKKELFREKECIYGDEGVLFTGRHFWNRKCRKKTWWQQEFAVFKCEATANSVTGHVCVNSNNEGGRDRRREYLNKNAWRGLAAIGVAVVLTMGECVSGIQLGIGKFGGSGMLTSYAEELWIPVSVTAETAQAAENAAELPVQAPEAILMEASTGTILYEKNADEARNPASVTKIMTLLLIFDALHSGKIHLQDEVTTSAHAKSMGGSQVFLEEGEVQTVETLIKCIVIASGNDASVAMAEYIGGSEEAFVATMNERAKGLGMETAKFEDCCGLTASTTHAMSARDIALMSRELITKYPEIFQYSTIWMENITHRTKQGEKEFGLSNTNKLLKMATNFEVTGLKTGSTSLAKYCLSATGRKDGVDLIAVILAAPDYKARFADAVTLLNYGFANCHLYKDENPGAVPETTVAGGIQEQVAGRLRGTFSYLSMGGENLDGIEKEWMMEESRKAPVREGDVIGHLVYRLDGRKLGSVEIEAAETVEKAGLWDYFKKVMGVFAA